MKAGIAVAAMGAAVLAFAASAWATPPQRFSDSFDYSGQSSCAQFGLGFDDVWEGTITFHGITTFDKEGNPVRDVVHFQRTETNWRSDNPDAAMTATGSWSIYFDYAADTETDHGQVFTQTFPGLGLLFHDVGSISFTPDGVIVHGPHDIFDQGDAAFCGALDQIG